MAFVSAVPVLSFSQSVAKTPARPSAPRAARVSMAMDGKSPSLPFMNKPTSVSEDMPGYAGFDPFNLAGVIDVKWMQEAEIKNGRVAMLGALGLVFPEIFSFPFYNPPAGVTLVSREMQDYFWANGAFKQILLWTHFAEVFGSVALYDTMTGGDRIPGYFGLDPLGLAGKPGTAKFAKFQTNEIKNGRLAMIACGGLIHGQWVTNQGTLFNLSHFQGIPAQF